MMNKNELEKILEGLNIPFNEGISNDKYQNTFPRIVYWDFLWEPFTASGKEYNTLVTYQLSFYSDIPRHPKLIELKKVLEKKNIHIRIEHEYVETKKCWHSYFGIEILENID